MDLEDIKALLRVVELGSVQGAARQLGVPRSTLRRRLRNLEVEVGGELLVTDASGVALTAAGSVVAEEGRALVERSARMLSAAKASRSDASGTLRVVLPIGMPNRLRVMMMQVLRSAAPELCIDELEFADPLAHLHEPFELMIHVGAPPAHGEWFSRVLARKLVVPVASQTYLDHAGRPTRVEDLARHALLSWRRPGALPTEWPLWAGGTVPVRPIGISDNVDLLHFAAQQGVGIVLGLREPSFLPETTELVPVLDDLIGVELVVRSLSPVRANANPRLRTVLANIQGALEALPG